MTSAVMFICILRCWQIGDCTIYRIDCNCFFVIPLPGCKSPNFRNNHNHRNNCNGLSEIHMQLQYCARDEPQAQPHLKCNCSRSKRSIAPCNCKLCRLQVQSNITLTNCNGDDCREAFKEFSSWAGNNWTINLSVLSEVDRNYQLHIAMRSC